MHVRIAATTSRLSVDRSGRHDCPLPCYRATRAESVNLINPAARSSPIARWTDSGCRTILLREPPIRTLAPKPGPNARLALAPT